MDSLLLSAIQAKPLLAKRGTAETARTSADLNLTKIEVVLTDAGVTFPQGEVSWDTLKKIVEQERKVFAIEDGVAKALQVFSESTGWVRSLCPTESAPTVLVSGIPRKPPIPICFAKFIQRGETPIQTASTTKPMIAVRMMRRGD